MRRRTTDSTLPAYEVASDTSVETPAHPLPGANPTQPAVIRRPTVEIVAEAARAPMAASRHGRALEERVTSWLLRAGLAFVLSYAAVSSLTHPETFARYFPSLMPATWTNRLLPVFALFETLLAVGLMTYRYAYVASILAGLTMVAIIAVNPHAFDVLFRNVAIACGAFALAVQSRRERGDGTPSQ